MVSCRIFGVFLLAFFLAFSARPCFAENVAELRIESITTPIQAGGLLEFSFIAGNRSGPGCAAEIGYWFGEDGEIQGNDTFYLEEHGTMTNSASLLLPDSDSGVKQFFLQMKCNDAVIVASRKIEIRADIPVLPLFSSLFISESGEGKQLEFVYMLQSNSKEAVPIHVQERIMQNDKIIWQNSQNIPIAQGTEIKRLGPILPLGNYKLIIDATSGLEKATVTREFEVKAATAAPAEFPFMQALAIAAVALLLFASLFTATRFFAKAPILQKPFAPFPLTSVKQGTVANEERLKLFESDSIGVADELEVNRLLDVIGQKGEERQHSIDFAVRTQVMKVAKSFIVIGASKEARFETSVSVSLANYTNRNWKKVVVLARLPKFLGEEILEISEDTKLNAEKIGPVIKFTLEKVGAMQSVSFAYKVGKLISQAEANSIPLPAVISYEEGEPLIITQVNVEGTGKKSTDKERQGQEENKVKIKAGKPENGQGTQENPDFSQNQRKD